MAVPRSLRIAAPISLALTACVYIPVTEQTAEAEPACRTVTNKMTVMELREVAARNNGRATTAYDRRGRWVGGDCGTSESCAVILAAIVTVAAGTYIVSGSVVILNNTAHWLEYQGTCNDSYLNTSKKRFLDSLGNPSPDSANLQGQ